MSTSNPTPTVTLTLDQATQAVTAAEATYNADQQTVQNIQTAIATATAPLAAAQSQVDTDKTAYVSALQNLIGAATAQIAALQSNPPAAS